MTNSAPLHTLGELLDRLEAAGNGTSGHSAAGDGAGECADKDTDEGKDNDKDAVTLGALIDEIGTRSFGPLLLLAGLVTVMPIVGDIPGVPTVMALLVLLVAGQLLLGREHFWLPRWVLDRRVRRDRLVRALGWLRRPARWVTACCGRAWPGWSAGRDSTRSPSPASSSHWRCRRWSSFPSAPTPPARCCSRSDWR